MEQNSPILYILLAILVTNLIRVLAGVIALVVGLIAAWYGLGLFPVALICCIIVYLIDTLLPML